MPAPDLPQLQVNPSGLLAWLEDNLLMAGSLKNQPNPNGLIWASIVPRPLDGMNRPARAVNASGRPVDVWNLRSDGGAHNGLRAYICNYTAKAVTSVDIGSLGDYCFTTNLNGCTYGIGPRQADGTRRVSHANRGGNTILQRTDIQNQNNVGATLPGVTMLEPAEYRRLGGELHATVFGIRSGYNWSFYYQSYSYMKENQYRLNGVLPIRLVG